MGDTLPAASPASTGLTCLHRSHLPRQVVAQPERYTYEGCREKLAQLYAEAELTPLAAFVCPETQ